MDEFKIFVIKNEQKQNDFNFFQLPTTLIPDLIKALNQELFLRSSKISFADERAKVKDSLGAEYSLKLYGSHVEFED